ncbi:MAG: AraC family transcriptional regulator ligand-binding domain-containing protein [Verrucomicrobiales bacterium]|nr:AraC family transcriptional regulator ligand-binding domain-containing protein [Verrucomicrobiales bacterium]
MHRIPLTRVAAFSPFIAYLEASGCNLAMHMSSAGIPREILQSEDNLIPLRQASAFLEMVSEKEGAKSLGLEVGSRTSMLNFGILGDILSRSLTLHDLLNRLVRWVPLLDSGAHVWVEAPEGSDCVRLCLRHDTDLGRELIDGYALFLMLDSVRLATGSTWRPGKVWLDRKAGSDLSDFEVLSEAEVDRQVDFVAFEIPKRFIPRTVKPLGGGAVRSQSPETDYLTNAPALNLEESVAQSIRSRFGNQAPTIGEIAELSHSSIRTLQRRLKESGQDFSEILDRVRFDEATALLSSGKPLMADISHHLGYSDPAHFTHAFRRWSGVSPQQYVEQLDRRGK